MLPGVVLALLALGCTRGDPGTDAAETETTATEETATGSGATESDDTSESGDASAPGDTGEPGEADPEPGGIVPEAEADDDTGTEPGSDGEAGDGDAPSDNVVRFVYFVEDGETERDDVRQAIERQAVELQAYWYRQFGGTFLLDDPVVTVVNGANDAAWYDTTPDGIHDDPRWYRLGNIATEVRVKLGTANTRFVTYPATTVAEPRVGVNFDGAWMDGDDALCILGEAISYPYPDGNDAHCLGHVAHELGHVFGLGHSGPQQDCMQFGFYDVDTMCRFSAANREAVRTNPFNVGWLDVDLDLPLDPDPDVDELAPDPETGPVDVIFENTGCRAIEFLWVEAEDQLRSYGTIAPGSTRSQSTFIGHRWVFQADTDEVGRFVVPGADTHRIDSGGC